MEELSPFLFVPVKKSPRLSAAFRDSLRPRQALRRPRILCCRERARVPPSLPRPRSRRKKAPGSPPPPARRAGELLRGQCRASPCRTSRGRRLQTLPFRLRRFCPRQTPPRPPPAAPPRPSHPAPPTPRNLPAASWLLSCLCARRPCPPLRARSRSIRPFRRPSVCV